MQHQPQQQMRGDPSDYHGMSDRRHPMSSALQQPPNQQHRQQQQQQYAGGGGPGGNKASSQPIRLMGKSTRSFSFISSLHFRHCLRFRLLCSCQRFNGFFCRFKQQQQH